MYFNKYELQNSVENNISCKKRKEISFWLNGDGLKQQLTMNPMEKQIIRMNTTLQNMTYLIVNKTILCQHNKLNPLTYRREKSISETMNGYIEISLRMIHKK